MNAGKVIGLYAVGRLLVDDADVMGQASQTLVLDGAGRKGANIGCSSGHTMGDRSDLFHIGPSPWIEMTWA